jgi:hypothetical protein
MLAALAAFCLISWIPWGAQFVGLLLYLGMGALQGNKIWERVYFCFMVAKKRPQVQIVHEVKLRMVQIFTFIQLVCTLCIFSIANFAKAGTCSISSSGIFCWGLRVCIHFTYETQCSQRLLTYPFWEASRNPQGTWSGGAKAWEASTTVSGRSCGEHNARQSLNALLLLPVRVLQTGTPRQPPSNVKCSPLSAKPFCGCNCMQFKHSQQASANWSSY